MKPLALILCLCFTPAAFAYDGEPWPAPVAVALPSIDQSAAMKAYKACAAADVATTAIGLATHTMMEGNPIARAMFIKALGPVVGMVAPVIALEVAGYFILRAIDKPAITAGAAALTCAASIRNVGIIGAAK